MCSYFISDARKGEIHSELTPDQHKLLENALKLGKQFCNDFGVFQGTRAEEHYDDNLKQTLIAVQIPGALYSEKALVN